MVGLPQLGFCSPSAATDPVAVRIQKESKRQCLEHRILLRSQLYAESEMHLR